MDNSHIALVALKLEASEFDEYRCDRNMPLGVNVRLIYPSINWSLNSANADRSSPL